MDFNFKKNRPFTLNPRPSPLSSLKPYSRNPSIPQKSQHRLLQIDFQWPTLILLYPFWSSTKPKYLSQVLPFALLFNWSANPPSTPQHPLLRRPWLTSPEPSTSAPHNRRRPGLPLRPPGFAGQPPTLQKTSETPSTSTTDNQRGNASPRSLRCMDPRLQISLLLDFWLL